MRDENERDSATEWSQTCPHCGAAIQRIARRCLQCGGDVEGDAPAKRKEKPRSEIVQIMEEVLAAAPLPLLLGMAGLLVCLAVYGFGATAVRLLMYVAGLF